MVEEEFIQTEIWRRRKKQEYFIPFPIAKSQQKSSALILTLFCVEAELWNEGKWNNILIYTCTTFFHINLLLVAGEMFQLQLIKYLVQINAVYFLAAKVQFSSLHCKVLYCDFDYF